MNENAKRGRRRHTAAFKAEAVAACRVAGVSLAGLALERQINANLLRRWVKEAAARKSAVATLPEVSPTSRVPAFLPVALERPKSRPAAADRPIRVRLRRSRLRITIEWPANVAESCAAWLKELVG